MSQNEASTLPAAMRVVLTGSESVGKTTLAAELARHYAAEVVPEFVRDYAASRGAPLGFGDHGPIAKGQMALEDAAIARARTARTPLVVQDTDLVSTVVYCDHYFGRCPLWIEEMARARLADLYLLLDIDVPWVADGVRDRGDRRPEMHAFFVSRLQALRARVTVIHGPWESRRALAVAAIDALLAGR